MPTRKHITPATKVSLKLSAAERTLILDLMCLDDEFEEVVRDTPPGEPIRLTLDEWDLFSGYIAAEANHTSDKKVQKKLDAIFDRVQDILDTHTDEEPELKVHQPGGDSAEDLDDTGWVLGLAAKLQQSREKVTGQAQTHRLKLTKPQRDALLQVSSVPKALKDRLAAGPLFLDLGLVELMEIAFGLSRASNTVSGLEKRMLVRIASKVAEGLTALMRRPETKP